MLSGMRRVLAEPGALLAVGGLIAVGLLLIIVGAFVDKPLDGYLQSALLTIGGAMFVAAPVLFAERAINTRLDEVQSSVEDSVVDSITTLNQGEGPTFAEDPRLTAAISRWEAEASVVVDRRNHPMEHFVVTHPRSSNQLSVVPVSNSLPLSRKMLLEIGSAFTDAQPVVVVTSGSYTRAAAGLGSPLVASSQSDEGELVTALDTALHT